MKSIFFVGDILVERIPDLNWDAIQKVFHETNAVICNFEGVLKGGHKPVIKAGPVIFQHPESIDMLHKIGVTAATTCNNHMYDFGLEALRNTEESLEASNIKVFGSELPKNQVFAVDSLSRNVTIIPACESHPVTIAGSSIIPLPDYMSLFSSELLKRISKAKENGDWVVVTAHAGLELVDIPLSNIRKRYKDLVKAGADMVVGHHPHVPQGFEEYMGKPIFYSLGNFVFQRESMTIPNINGIALRVEFDDEKFSYETYSVEKDKNSSEVSLRYDNLDRFKNLLEDDSHYQLMLEKAKSIHGEIFESSAPLFGSKSLKGWLKLIINLLIRPLWLIKRRKLIAELIKRNESYIGLKQDLDEREV